MELPRLVIFFIILFESENNFYNLMVWLNIGLRYGCHAPISKLDSTDGRLLTPLLLLSSGRTTLEVVCEIFINCLFTVMYIRVFFRSSDQKNRGPWAVEAFRRGPSSVESVRRGEVGFAYDTPYVI